MNAIEPMDADFERYAADELVMVVAPIAEPVLVAPYRDAVYVADDVTSTPSTAEAGLIHRRPPFLLVTRPAASV